MAESLRSFLRDLRFGLRQLLKRPGFTVVSIAILALGIGANTAIFSMVRGVMYGTADFDEVDRLVWIGEHTEQIPNMSVSYPNYRDWAEQTQSFEGLASHRYRSMTLTEQGPAQQVTAVAAASNLFDLLRVEPLFGRDFSPAEDAADTPTVVVLSHGFWRRELGGDRAAIGSTLRLDGEPFEVVGVMPPDFVYPLWTRQLDVWVPMGLDAREDIWQDRGDHPGLYVTGRLKDGASYDAARTDIERVAANLAQAYPDTNEKHGIAMSPVRDVLNDRVAPAFAVLSAAVGLVLLLACINVANLQLARGADRMREIAVRVSLGARRAQIFGQLFTESLLLSVFGGLAGLVLAWAGLELLHRQVDFDVLPAFGSIELDAPVLAFALVVSLTTGVLFGLAPALQALRRDVADTIRDGARGGDSLGRQRVRSLLVIGQVSLAVVLLAGALLFASSFRNLATTDPGFDPQGVLSFSLDLRAAEIDDGAEQSAFFDQLRERLAGLPGVESVATTLPLLGNWQTTVVAEGMEKPKPGDEISTDISRVSTGYFATMGVDLQEGRVFDSRDHQDAEPVAIVDRTFADHFFPGQDAVGRRIKVGSDPAAEDRSWLRIVGIVDHVKNYGINQPSRIELYLPAAQNPRPFTTVVVATSLDDPMTLVEPAKAALFELSQSVPLAQPARVESLAGRNHLANQALAGLLSAFAIVATALAALGLYGVLSYAVSRRRREIGLRMALGADRGDVARLVIRRCLGLVGIGLGSGLVLVWFAVPVAESQLYGIAARDPSIFGLVVLVLLVVGFGASTIPQLRASRIDPAIALREE